VAGLALGPTVIGIGTRHLPPSRTHAPVTNPRYGRRTRQLFSGRGGCPGSKCNCRAWLTDDSNSCSRPRRKSPESIVPANSLLRLGPAAGSRCRKQHEHCVNIAHVVTLRSQGQARSARHKDGSSHGRLDLAVEPLVHIKCDHSMSVVNLIKKLYSILTFCKQSHSHILLHATCIGENNANN